MPKSGGFGKRGVTVAVILLTLGLLLYIGAAPYRADFEAQRAMDKLVVGSTDYLLAERILHGLGYRTSGPHSIDRQGRVSPDLIVAKKGQRSVLLGTKNYFAFPFPYKTDIEIVFNKDGKVEDRSYSVVQDAL